MTRSLFAAQFACLDQAGDSASSLVMFGARLGVLVLVGVTLWNRLPTDLGQYFRAWRAAIGGVLLLVGDIVYLSALANGPLTTASVLGGLHPVVTIALARFLEGDSLSKTQLGGIILALTGTVLISLS